VEKQSILVQENLVIVLKWV